MNDTPYTRRTILQAGTAGAMTSALAGQAAAADHAGPAQPDVYGELGLKPIINAAGTITTLGGSLMPPEVRDAWMAAASSFVDLLALQDRVGENIARLLQVESALVTTGAAGGILVGTAAALTFRDRQRTAQLPLPPNAGVEVIRQKSHRECYDHLVRACGVKLIDVETAAELRRAINDRTALLFSYNVHEDTGKIKRPEWVAIAREHKIPTLMDAAADVPPLSRLSEYTRMGYDMVVFSGGKALRGPQGAGLLLGKREFIEAAKRNTAPRCTIGRGMKVSKEDMVAMWAAVKRFVELDHDAEWQEWERKIDVIATRVQDLPTMQISTVVPPIANHVPHLLLKWDERQLAITPQKVSAELAAGTPSIRTARVHGTGTEGFLISVFMLRKGEEVVVANRVRNVFDNAKID